MPWIKSSLLAVKNIKRHFIIAQNYFTISDMFISISVWFKGCSMLIYCTYIWAGISRGMRGGFSCTIVIHWDARGRQACWCSQWGEVIQHLLYTSIPAVLAKKGYCNCFWIAFMSLRKGGNLLNIHFMQKRFGFIFLSFVGQEWERWWLIWVQPLLAPQGPLHYWRVKVLKPSTALSRAGQSLCISDAWQHH